MALVGAFAMLLLTTSTAFAATGNNVWRATLTSATSATATATTTSTPTVRGGATIVEVGNGRLASVAVKLYGVRPDSVVQVMVTDTTATTAATTPNVWTSPKFRMAATGVNRFWLKGSDVKPLDAAIDAKDTLSITVTVTPPTGTRKGTAPSVSTKIVLTGTFSRVR
ncbi:MAG: hypothetical protein ACP5VP_00800 [Candidatus Limnocylindrales bacterium]